MGIDLHACRPDELERLLPLLDEEFVFGKGRTISLRLRFPTVYCGDNLHNIFLCTDGEAIISALAMRQFNWREGSDIFRGAMIGAVYTHPTRRGKGLASRLLEAAAMHLREGEVDFGVLWTGQPSFYARLGWVAADSGALGEIEPSDSAQESSSIVIRIPMPAGASLVEDIRRRCLNNMTLRRAEDYRQLPLPAESVEMLWREDQGKVAYALLGNSGTTGFIYELVGDAACFSALWREACCGHRQLFVNDRADSPSSRWLTDNVGMNWKNKNLAMWLPLSKRVDMPRLGQWHIPYFDRI